MEEDTNHKLIITSSIFILYTLMLCVWHCCVNIYISTYLHIYAPSGLVIHVMGLLAAGLLGPLLGLSAVAGAGAAAGVGRRGCSS